MKEYRLLGVRLDGAGPFLRETKLGSESAANTLFQVKECDFVYSRLFAWRGAFGVIGPELQGAYVSGEFPTFVPASNALDVHFLRLWFRLPGTIQKVEADCSGSTPLTRNRFKESFFLSLEVPLPPLDEQRRIVTRMDELAAKIEEARRLREQAVADAESLTPCAATIAFTDARWSLHSIEALVGRANLKNGKSIKVTTSDSEVRCLRLSGLREGRIDCKDSKPVPLTLEEAKPYLVNLDDVFIVRGNGSKELVGRAGMITESCEGIIFPDLFIRVPLDRTRVLPSYFVAVWNSSRVRRVIEEIAKTTSGIWKINQGHIASVRIPVPQVAEQRRIVAHIDALQAKVDALKRLQAETAAELDALLPSILDRAFKGEL